MMNLVPLELAGPFAISQHEHSVGQFLDLSEPMRNINDAYTTQPQCLDDPIQLVRLALAQAGAGFVHDQHASLRTKRLGDLDHLLLTQRKRAHEGAWRTTQPDLGKVGSAFGIKAASIHEAGSSRFASEKNICRD